MLVLLGYLIVCASVIGGFVLSGGHVKALMQPLELLIIFGAAFGAFVVSNSSKALKATFKSLPLLFKSSHYNKKVYVELLSLMYVLLLKMKRDGAISIDNDIERPKESPIFAEYPAILKDHHVMEFICDYMRLMINGNLDPNQIESLMDQELETHHKEAHVPIEAITKMADGMPAFGIVAAVLGVVHTMESVTLPPAELGILIAAALVGTFLGILIGYGFIGPLAVLLQHRLNESTKVFECLKVTLLATMHGYIPQVAVEFGRKVLYSSERPSSGELEEAVKGLKTK